MKKAIRINESQLRAIIVESVIKTLSEGYLYHKGSNIDMTNPEPYHSENRWRKWEGSGHETGSFGSGTYFTSSLPYDARFNDEDKDIIRKGQQIGGRFIQLRSGTNAETGRNRSGLYRVDTDFFSNLYQLRSEKEGDLLKDLMNSINSFVRGCKYDSQRDYSSMRNRQRLYMKIVSKCQILGLNMPWNYREMCVFAKNYVKDESIRQTPATIFMEKNGYNGVDATYAGRYDSYWEGSVIYDLNKVEGNIEPVKNPRDEFKVRNYDLLRTMTDDLNDAETSPNYFNDKTAPNEVLSSLKRYPMVLASSKYWSLPSEIKPTYLKLLYNNIKKGYVNLHDAYSHYSTYGIKELCDRAYIQDIIKYGLVQYVNVDESVTRAIFSELTHAYSYDKETFEKFLNAYQGDMSVIEDDVEFIRYMYS